MSDTPDTILIIHLAGMGDLLMGLPAFAALRAGYPDSRLMLLTWAHHAELARLVPSLDGCELLAPEASFSSLWRNLATAWRLRRRRVDLAVNLYGVYRRRGAWKLRWLLRLVRPARTAGRNTDGQAAFFDLAMPERTDESLHEVERQVRLVERLGCRRVEKPAALNLDPADEVRVTQWLRRHGVEPDTPLIMMHPGGARLNHRWPWRAFAAVAQALEDRWKARIVITGNRRERSLAEKIAGRLRKPLMASGELSIGQLACLLPRCRVVITNDSGPMHLAALLRAPLIAIAGPTDPQRFGPFPPDRPDQVILHADGCDPCYRNHCGGHVALEQMPVDAVLRAVEAILRGDHPTGRLRIPRRVRVLHVHTLPVISGSGINTWLTLNGLPPQRYAVELACGTHVAAPAPGESLLDLVEQRGLRVHRVRHLVQPVHPWHDALATVELWRLMRRHRYTIVHTHNSKAGVLGRLVARLTKVPVILHTVHGFPFHAQETPWRRALFRAVERMASRWCDHLIVISEPLIDWALRDRIAPREKMSKIYSGIDLQAFSQPVNAASLRAQWGFHDHAFIVGEVAKLWPGKGHDTLLRAAALLKDRAPDLRLFIVGEGALRPSLERLAQELGLAGRVVFAGFRSDVPALTKLLDVAVLPSLFEGMGRAILEAQASGTPVIASRVGGIPEFIMDGQTGLLIEPGHVEQLAEAMWRLYTKPELRHRLSQAATQRLDGRFDASTMVQQIADLYERLLDHQRAVSAC